MCLPQSVMPGSQPGHAGSALHMHTDGQLQVVKAHDPEVHELGRTSRFASALCVFQALTSRRSAAEPGTADLKLLAALEGGLEPEREPEGPTMMGREARELMLSGQGDKALQLFKVTHAIMLEGRCCFPGHQTCVSRTLPP